jgi:hypothetical protein
MVSWSSSESSTVSYDLFKDEDRLKGTETPLLRLLFCADMLPRWIDAAGVVERLVPGVS